MHSYDFTHTAVFATTWDHRTFRVSDPFPNEGGWGNGQREWGRLETLRLAGRMPHVKFYEVRSVALGPDRPLVGPEVRSHDRYDLAKLDLTYARPVVAGSRGHLHVEDAARAAWKRLFPTYRSWWDRRTGSQERTGTQGLGGWFYYPNGHTAAQGLHDLARVCKRRGLVVQGGNGRWYVFEQDEDSKVAA